MKEWFVRFWDAHGERIFFMGIVAFFGGLFWYLGMPAEGKTLLIADATLALNKARGTLNGKKLSIS